MCVHATDARVHEVHVLGPMALILSITYHLLAIWQCTEPPSSSLELVFDSTIEIQPERISTCKSPISGAPGHVLICWLYTQLVTPFRSGVATLYNCICIQVSHDLCLCFVCRAACQQGVCILRHPVLPSVHSPFGGMIEVRS